MSNDFIPFAVGGSANVTAQATYAANTTLTQNGFQAGIAKSPDLNKVWRQSSIMAAVLAQFIVDQSGQNAVDDGTTTTLEANLISAIRNAAKQTVILTDTGAANAYTAANTPALTVLPGTGYTQRVNIAHANTGASTYAPDGLVAKPIFGLGLQPLQGGELPVGVVILMYLVQASVNSGNGAWIIIESLGGSQQIAPATQSQHAVQMGQVTGRLLRTTVYTNPSGTQLVSVNGGTATSTGASTFTPLALTTTVKVKVLGGGGGGGGSQNTGSGQASIAGPGNAGAYGESWYTSGFSGIAVTVGAGGISTAAAAGTNGGTSSFGALVSSPGGKGGVIGVTGATPSGAYPQSSVVPSGANLISAAGALGTVGIALAAAAGLASIGGNSAFGAGGVFGSGNATGYGSGGAGSFIPQSTTGVAAGNGSAGFVVVEEYA